MGNDRRQSRSSADGRERAAIKDVASAAQDPAELLGGRPPTYIGALGQSPTPELGAPGDDRGPFIPTGLVSGAQQADRRRSAAPDTTVDAAPPEFSSPLTGVAFGARGSFVGALPESGPTADGSAPPLRREESVLAEAARVRPARHKRFTHYVKRLNGRLGATTGGAGAAIMRGLRAFDRLPKWKQVVWVSLPYACAVGLVFVLLTARSGAVHVAVSPGADPASRAPTKGSAKPSSAGQETRGGAASSVDGSAAARSDAPVVASAPAGTVAPLVVGQAVKLPRRSALYVRPDPTAHRSARLRAGHVVTVYPDFPSPDGWVLARSQRGTVGFISKRHLIGKSDPAINRARRLRRRQQARQN